MIEAKNISKSYESLEVLKNLDVFIQKGELVSIVGSSGAGKTTLLQILGSLLKPDKGEVNINGTSIYQLKNKELARFRNQELGFVFQFHQLLPEFTALENVMLPGMIAKRKPKELKNYAIDLFHFLNIQDRLQHKPSELSGGEQQRIAVARALINQPSVIFADEPTGNLDSNNTDELFQLLVKLKKELNQTVLMVTHNETLAMRSERIIKIKDGQILD